MTNVVVYSCVTGGYDKLENTFSASSNVPENGVKYVLFSDKQRGSAGKLTTAKGVEWEVRPLIWQHRFCGRRTARWHKLNPEAFTDQGDISIWIDASQRIKVERFVERLLAATVQKTPQVGIFSFKHPQRNCIYQELQACIDYRKDNPVLMRKQIEFYRTEGYPTSKGLVETACVVRRHTPSSVRFDRLWWYMLDHHSLRDQLSFNYVAWKNDTAFGRIPGCRLNSPFFDFVPHGS
jgi:hypothetical protein